MSIHEKLAARLREKYNHTRACAEAKQPRRRTDPECFACEMHVLADEVELGRHDGVLGVRAPTIEDVERETKRVSGRDDATVKDWGGAVVVLVFTLSSSGKLTMPLCVEAPSVPSAYAALRALPDYEVGK